MKIDFKSVHRALSGISIIFLFLGQPVFAQLHPQSKESSVHFTIKNFGFKTGGTLAAPEGDIIFNPADLSKSYFHVTINSESINTDNESRDAHLREADYFDVKNHPQIRFVSDQIKAAGGKGMYTAIGTLTIKNKSKEIQLPFTAQESEGGYLFTGSFQMNRRDFGIGGGSTLSNDLTVDIKVLAR